MRRIVVFYLTSIDNSAQNRHLLPLVHSQFCTELSSSTSRPSTIPHRIVIFYRWSIHNSAQNCRLLPLVHFTTAGRQVRAMVVKCTVVVARNGAQEGRCPQSRTQGTRKACYSTWFVCLFVPCLPSSFFGFFMVWSFSDHVVSSVLYISW
jgi:hypothetical protein